MARKKNAIWYVISSLILIAIVVLCIVFRDNIKTAFSGQVLYTAEQYNQAYVDGQNQIKQETETNRDKVNSLKSENAELDLSLIENAETWEGLQNEFNQEQLKNSNLNQQISSANNSIENLQQIIKRYTGVIPDLLDENECLVVYRVGEEIQAYSIVEKGTVLTSSHMATFEEDCYDIFNYWQLNGVETNPIGYTVNNNVEFVANITHRYLVWTTVNGARTSHVIETWADLTDPTDPTDKFKGWKLNNKLVKLENIALENNLELVAEFRERVTLHFDYILQDQEGNFIILQDISQHYYWIEDTVFTQNLGSALYSHEGKFYVYSKTAFYASDPEITRLVINEETGVSLTKELSSYRVGIYLTEYLGD